jgi:hypothetical protein
MKGRTARVKVGLKVNIVATVKPVVRRVRKIAGTRSDPKYAISSMGSLRG